MNKTIEAEDGMEPGISAKANAIQQWLVGEARFIDDPDTVTKEFIQRILDAGVPLDRMTSAIPTLYAVRLGLGRLWTQEDGLRTLEFSWDTIPAYEASPYYRAHQTRDWVSFRLDEIADEDFGVVGELRAGGYTQYLCMPIFFRDSEKGGIAYATRRPEGFSEADVALLRAIGDAVAGAIDLTRVWILLRETLRMYVGEEPQARILSGQVRRGDVVNIRSAIMFADMRGFTQLSAKMTTEETVALLNRYFDCVVPPVEEASGSVLKYIGDGVLAIFRADQDEQVACTRALETAHAVVRRVQEERAKADNAARFDIKIALHFGEVAYGNIGSGARLDYTIVGKSVNLASRLADLAGNLERHILLSSEFALRLPNHSFRALGEHELRGVPEPQQVFAPMS